MQELATCYHCSRISQAPKGSELLYLVSFRKPINAFELAPVDLHAPACAYRFHLRLHEPIHMFGTPVVEETPRSRYGATAYGLLGETKSTTSRTLFGQPDPPPPPPRRIRDPTLMDPSTFLRLSPPQDGTEEEDRIAAQSALPEETNHRSNPKRHGQLRALESMNNPLQEAPIGSHLYDSLGASARHMMHDVPDSPPSVPLAFKSPAFPLPDVGKAHFGDSLNRPETFMPLDEGLFGSSRRLLQIPPPPFPPSQPVGLQFQSGDYYTSYASVVGAGYYGFHGSISTTSLANPPGG